jgi:uncharacterized protein YndB with AHSA1/START domain
MTTLHFAIVIRAPRGTVWDVMLAPATYTEWTAEFMEGSYFEGSWEQGSRIRFLAPDGNGMVAVIAENRPHQFLSIKQLGYVKDGIEDTESEMVTSWAPAFENYTLRDADGATELAVDLDVTPEFEEYMTKIWPAALARLKTLCEGRG